MTAAAEMLDFSTHYEEVCGYGTAPCFFKYSQNGKYYNPKGQRINPENGELWGGIEKQKEEDLKAVVEAAKENPELEAAAQAAKKGVELPRRIITLRGKK